MEKQGTGPEKKNVILYHQIESSLWFVKFNIDGKDIYINILYRNRMNWKIGKTMTACVLLCEKLPKLP